MVFIIEFIRYFKSLIANDYFKELESIRMNNNQTNNYYTAITI